MRGGVGRGVGVGWGTLRVPEVKRERVCRCLRNTVDKAGPNQPEPFMLPEGLEPGPSRKLIDHPDLEIPRPTLVGMSGFVGFWVAVGLAMLLMRRVLPFTRGAFPLLVWGGLRGGISIALALTLPDGPLRDLILSATYVVVVFSVVIQGATVAAAARRFVGDPEKLERPDD